MLGHTNFRDLLPTVLRFSSIFDLGRIARTNKYFSHCVSREIIARIGQNNFDLVSAGVVVQHNDLKYFYEGVTDSAAYWPLVAALRRRYTSADLYIRRGNNCSSVSLRTIIPYWLHIGLSGCARLIFDQDAKIFAIESDSCEMKYHINAITIYLAKPFNVSDLTQGQLLWFIIASLSTELVFKNNHLIPDILDTLDWHTFNILIDIVTFIRKIGAHGENMIRASDARRPRYDPNFVRRTAAMNGLKHTIDESARPLDVLRHCPTCVKVELHIHFNRHRRRENSCECECHDCFCGACNNRPVQCRPLMLCSDCRCCICNGPCMCPCECGSLCRDGCACCRCKDGCVCYE